MSDDFKNAQRKAVSLTNSLSSLIPLGTLYFTDLPRIPQKGIEAEDGWCWFDAPYLLSNVTLVSYQSVYAASFAPIIQDLCYLMERLFIKITYKLLSTSGLAALRIYIIPTDISGNRHLEYLRNLYRYSKALNWHTTRYKLIMTRLLSVLDYSIDNWNLKVRHNILVFSALKPYEKFDIKNIGSASYLVGEGSLDFHLGRLHRREPFHFNTAKTIEGLEERLADVYNSIQFKKDYPIELLQKAEDIDGLRSPLYNYQVETIAKMLNSEVQGFHKVLPNLQPIHSHIGHPTFYVDVLNLAFNRSAEYYNTPRGGILAENMGLGKTFICLALICMTKNEASEIPDRFVVPSARDYKTLSLFDQCVRVINRQSIPWKSHIDSIPENCVKKLEENPGFFYVKRQDMKKRTFREKPLVLQEKFLLTAATLIVCPDNLFQQWVQEISKHVENGHLNVLQLPIAKNVPSALVMCRYDIVLMSVSAYVDENPITSQITKIYWKRLIIDEGHSMHQRSTRAVDLSKELKVERKWAVTGTPTSGMTKLHVNEKDESLKGDKNKNYTIKRSFNPKDDLTRLGYLISNFFQIEPWASSYDNLWTKNVVKPFIENNYGSTASLVSLVNDLIIRHSSEQIESDVLLPPLFHKPVLLEPSYHNQVSINIFTAVLATNAISSEREDKDYMFHSSNKVDLRRLVTNLQRATFYWTGFSIEDLENMSYIIKVSLDKQNKDGSTYYSEEDTNLLRKSLDACKVALRDNLWRVVSTIHEMEYFVNDLDPAFRKNFGIGKLNDASVFGAPQLYSLQNFYYKNRFTKGQSLDDKISTHSEAFWKDYWKEATKKNSDRTKKNDGQTIEIPKVNEELDLQDRVMLKSGFKTKFNDPNLVKSSNGKIDLSNGSKSATPEPSSHDSHKARILGTSSAKLSYMVSRLLEHQYTGVKSLVFFEFEDSAYYLSEALDLLGITYTLYATSVPKDQRFQKIDEFSNSPGSHCLIMDLKLASHGLTITAATRVYFLNPVWRRSIEAQAIKRAHRIGQLNAVHVETLILKNTLEEEMFKKRLAIKDELQIPVADDNEIQEYISKFDFLTTNDKVRYTEFKSECVSGLATINSKAFEPQELLEPTWITLQKKVHWNIPLFSKSSQEKISETEQHRHAFRVPKDTDIDQAQKSILHSRPTEGTVDVFIEHNHREESSMKRPNPFTDNPTFKRVRFLD